MDLQVFFIKRYFSSWFHFSKPFSIILKPTTHSIDHGSHFFSSPCYPCFVWNSTRNQFSTGSFTTIFCQVAGLKAQRLELSYYYPPLNQYYSILRSSRLVLGFRFLEMLFKFDSNKDVRVYKIILTTICIISYYIKRPYFILVSNFHGISN